MLSTTWGQRDKQDTVAVVSPTKLLRSLPIGKEFKSKLHTQTNTITPPRQTVTPELKQERIPESPDDGEIATPLKTADVKESTYCFTPDTNINHNQSTPGTNLNQDQSNFPCHDDTAMIHPVPISPDSTATTPTAKSGTRSKNKSDHVLTPSLNTNGNGRPLHHSDHKSGNRWFNLRSKTASKLRTAVERSRQAEILGVDRTRTEHTIQKREYNLKQRSSTASITSSTGALSAGDELVDHNDAPVTRYKPTSSCDGDVRSVGSGVSREKTLAGAILSAARTVDRKRTAVRNKAIEAAIADRVAMADVAKVALRSSLSLSHGNIPFVDSDGETKGSLDSFKSDEIPFTDVKRRMHGLRKENQSLVNERDHLQKQLNIERQQSLRTLKQARKEVEERNLKLAVLEEHFMALNEHSNDDDIYLIENAGLSFESTDSTTRSTVKSTINEGESYHDNASHQEDDNTSHHYDDNTSHQHDDNTSHQHDDDVSHQHDDSVSNVSHVSHKSTSIIRLDKSYLANLKKSYRKTKSELDTLKHDNAEKQSVKEEMMRQLEDLTERLRCRETTISSLDQALKQMRLSRFKQRSTLKRTHKSHRRRGTLMDVSAVHPIDEPEIEEASTVSMNTSENNLFNEDIIAEAVNNALDIKGKEHAIEIKLLQDKLELKETLVRKLKLKNGSMKRMNSSKRSLSCMNLGDPSSESSMMRNITMTNEIMNTLTFRLEAMLTKIDESTQPAEGIYDVGIDIPDELAPIRKLGSKISLVNDEMKVSVLLIKQRMKNEFESIKNGSSTQKLYVDMERPKSAGQATGSGDSCSTDKSSNNIRQSDRHVHKEAIDAIQARIAKMIHDAEISIGKNIKDVKYQIQDMEVVMGSKQDMVEALELACSEHDRNFRSLQEQMAAMVLRLEERADQEPGQEQMDHRQSGKTTIEQCVQIF